VKRWIGGQPFEPIRSPDTVGATPEVDLKDIKARFLAVS
jgi:hypothetical protein